MARANDARADFHTTLLFLEILQPPRASPIVRRHNAEDPTASAAGRREGKGERRILREAPRGGEKKGARIRSRRERERGARGCVGRGRKSPRCL